MEKKKTKKIITVLLMVVVLAGVAVISYSSGKKAGQLQKTQTASESSTESTGVSPNPAHEAKVNALAWQLSAESQGLIMQAFSTAEDALDELIAKCNDAANTEWTIETDEDGNPCMMHNGVRVAIVSDIDDTLVDGAHYTADIVGNDGDYNNAAFARFVMSDGCTALPGAVDFVNKCVENGIDFYYVTNRYDQAYKIDQSDSQGSYEDSIAAEGKGLYCKADGTEIGSSLYQTYGKTIYDISYESMERLGFPVDDQHLIVNDSKLNGSSKEAIRTAIREGSETYPNGQRTDGNSLNCATQTTLEPHEIVLLLGDNIGDFTDDFSSEELNAVSRSDLASDSSYADKWGKEWILFPNAMYGSSLDYADSYDMNKLFKYYAYTTE